MALSAEALVRAAADPPRNRSGSAADPPRNRSGSGRAAATAAVHRQQVLTLMTGIDARGDGVFAETGCAVDQDQLKRKSRP